jgi:ADP-heptose:LPS heptosyltransferase
MSAEATWQPVERIRLSRSSDGLGSLVLARPALAAVRAHFPEAVVETPGPSAAAMIVADLGVTLVPAGAAHTEDVLRIDIDAPGPPRRSREHVNDRYQRTLGAALGTAPDHAAAGLAHLTGIVRRHGAVIVHATSRVPSRRWSGFASVARCLLERGHRVVLVGHRNDASALAAVARDGGVAAEDNLVGRTDLPSLLRLVAGAPLVVSGDTAIGHLATALGTPSVRVMRRSAAAERAPKSGPHSVLRNAHIDAVPAVTVVETCLMRLDRGA